MNEPLDTSLIEQRLREQISTDVLQLIKGAGDFAAVKSISDFRPGSAFVVPGKESPVIDVDAKPGDRNRGRQQIISQFGVIIAARSYRDRTGSAAMQEMSPLIGLVRGALIGWSPVSPWKPIAWKEGATLDYDHNTLLWAEVFTTTHFIGNGGTS